MFVHNFFIYIVLKFVTTFNKQENDDFKNIIIINYQLKSQTVLFKRKTRESMFIIFQHCTNFGCTCDVANTDYLTNPDMTDKH